MGMLPIIAAGAAIVLLAGKKKKKKVAPPEEGVEPDEMPGMGMGPGETGILTISARAAKQVEPELLIAARAIPAAEKKDPEKMAKDAADEQDEEDKKDPPKKTGCKIGTVSADKKMICWGDPAGAFTASIPQRRKMRRVPKYKTARRAVAAVALTGGIVASPAMRFPQTRFMLYCWVNRKRKKIYRCTKRWKRGRKSCRRWARY